MAGNDARRPDDSRRPDPVPATFDDPPRGIEPPKISTTPHLSGTFGRYRILKKLGQGGMAVVYLAEDTQLARPVALKVPQVAGEAGSPTRQRFLREARAAATLRHPNICPVYDVGEIDGLPYLTMAYVEGRPLSDVLRGKPLPQRHAAALARKLALALEEAHARGVVHRDLKPSNVLMDERDEPVVMDFGLARRADASESRLTHDGAILGTPAYMAPEQADGDVNAMGPRCDVYSLGVILYEMLVGRRPFEGPTMALLVKVMTEPPPPPSSIRPDLDPRLEAVCLKALTKKPETRFASMKAFATALDEFLAEPAEASSQPATQPLPPTPSAVRRSTTGRVVGLLFAAVVLIGAGLAAYLALSPSGKPEDHGTVAIRLPADSTDLTLELDGEPLDPARLEGPLRLGVGDHALSVSGKDVEAEILAFAVRPGENSPLDIRVRRRPPDPEAEARAVAERVRLRVDPAVVWVKGVTRRPTREGPPGGPAATREELESRPTYRWVWGDRQLVGIATEPDGLVVVPMETFHAIIKPPLSVRLKDGREFPATEVRRRDGSLWLKVEGAELQGVPLAPYDAPRQRVWRVYRDEKARLPAELNIVRGSVGRLYPPGKWPQGRLAEFGDHPTEGLLLLPGARVAGDGGLPVLTDEGKLFGFTLGVGQLQPTAEAMRCVVRPAER